MLNLYFFIYFISYIFLTNFISSFAKIIIDINEIDGNINNYSLNVYT